MEIYKCKHCDEVYEKVFEGSTCDGTGGCACEDMNKLNEKSADFTTEKHVPIVEKTTKGIKVTVGSVPHPMIDTHWITMIEVISGNRSYKAFLKPGDPPEAEFPIDDVNVKAREYCNVHGLWTNKL